MLRFNSEPANMQKRILRHDITIHALTTKLWRVLTSSTYIEQFLFDGRYVSDWTKDSPIFSSDNNEAGQRIEKGLVREVVPGISLQFTLFGPGEFSNDPVGFLYELVPDQGGIMLILSVDLVYSSDHLCKLMDEHSKMMLQKIKWLAEYVEQ
jgi:hypothetical protein